MVDSQEVVCRASAPPTGKGGLAAVEAIPGLSAPVARGIRYKATTVEILRKSDMGAAVAEGPVLDRAVRLTTEKNLGSTAKQPAPGTNLDPIFAILQDILDAHFQIGRAHV